MTPYNPYPARDPAEALGRVLGTLVCLILSVAVPYLGLWLVTLQPNPLLWTALDRLLWILFTGYLLTRLVQSVRAS